MIATNDSILPTRGRSTACKLDSGVCVKKAYCKKNIHAFMWVNTTFLSLSIPEKLFAKTLSNGSFIMTT